jgi:hypothetical protein
MIRFITRGDAKDAIFYMRGINDEGEMNARWMLKVV